MTDIPLPPALRALPPVEVIVAAFGGVISLRWPEITKAASAIADAQRRHREALATVGDDALGMDRRVEAAMALRVANGEIVGAVGAIDVAVAEVVVPAWRITPTTPLPESPGDVVERMARIWLAGSEEELSHVQLAFEGMMRDVAQGTRRPPGEMWRRRPTW